MLNLKKYEKHAFLGLRLNPAKALIIWLCGRQQRASRSTAFQCCHRRHNGGQRTQPCVVLGSQLMSVHNSSMCQSAYYQLRQLRPIIRSLSVVVVKVMGPHNNSIHILHTYSPAQRRTAAAAAYIRPADSQSVCRCRATAWVVRSSLGGCSLS